MQLLNGAHSSRKEFAPKGEDRNKQESNRIADSGSLYLFALKLFITSNLAVADLLPYRVLITQKEITSQTDKHLVNLSSKTYVFEDKLTKY